MILYNIGFYYIHLISGCKKCIPLSVKKQQNSLFFKQTLHGRYILNTSLIKFEMCAKGLTTNDTALAYKLKVNLLQTLVSYISGYIITNQYIYTIDFIINSLKGNDRLLIGNS